MTDDMREVIDRIASISADITNHLHRTQGDESDPPASRTALRVIRHRLDALARSLYAEHPEPLTPLECRLFATEWDIRFYEAERLAAAGKDRDTYQHCMVQLFRLRDRRDVLRASIERGNDS